jgi:WD40 repeat protein/tRNA A-37 threonylcarbamoyl transferase component Bud32
MGATITEQIHTVPCGKQRDEIPLSETAGAAPLPPTQALETAAFDGKDIGPTVSVSRLDRFGDYEILEEIAHGGMGVVYRARQVSLNRIVALKMIRTGEFASAAEVERFQSEAEAAAMLEHPHIVSIHEIGTQQYFSMQLIEGGSLATALRQGQWLAKSKDSARRAAQLLATVAWAVHYAHQRGILHRDLKPGNILLDAQGQPFVTDFGLAKHVESDSALTQSGQIVGTASYMSPEQASAGRKLTTATDVYSLGAILYELLTARPPHRGDSMLDTLVMVRQQEPARPMSINPGADFDLETICLKCLDKDPARRYGSAEALAEDLERWLHHEPIRARRSSLLERAGKWARRQPVIAAMTASILLLVAVGFVAVTLAWQAAAQAEKDKDQQRRVAVAAQRKAEEARDEEKEHRKKADDAQRQEQEQRRKFQRLYVEQLLDKVANLNDKNDGARAALWLGRGLQAVAPEDEDLNRVLRINLGELRSRLAPLKAMLPHQKKVLVAAFSNDGKRVLTGSEDATACLWDADTGKLLATLKHANPVYGAAFSPDDKFIATGANNGKGVQLWDADGKAIGPRLNHPNTVGRLTFSPDGKKLLTHCSDRAVRLWNIEDVEAPQLIGEMRNDLKLAFDSQIFAMAFSPDSKLVVTVGRAGFTQLWDASTAKPFGPSLHSKGNVFAVQFCSNSKLVTGGESGLKFYTVGKEEAPQEIPGLGTIHRLDYTPDLKLLAAGGSDGNVRIYSGTALQLTVSHKDRVLALAFSRDGKMLLTGSEDQTVRLWDSETGLPLGMPYSMPWPVYRVDFSADGKTMLAQGPDKIVRLLNTPGSDAMRLPLRHGRGGIIAVAVSRDGKRVVAAISPSVPGLGLWNADTGELLALIKVNEKPLPSDALRSVAFHPDGQVFLTGGVDKTARLWDATTVKEIGKPCPHQAGVSLVLFRPDGKAFVAVANRSAQFWDTATQERLGKPMNSKRPILAAAFSPDGKVLLTAGGEAGVDGEGARLWDTATGEPIGDGLKHPAEIIRAVAFSPDGRFACTAGDDNTVRLWDMASNEMRAELRHNGPVEVVAFSNDGKTLLTGSEDHTARLWDVATGKLRLPPIVHDRGVQSVAFSADDRLIATGCRDQAARIWDAATGKLVSTPRRLYTAVRQLVFSPDGKTLLSSGSGPARCIRLWPVPSPLSGDAQRLVLWTQVLTGMELNSEGVVNALDAEQWQERRERLEKLGGPP